jgi:beta-lactamase class C
MYSTARDLSVFLATALGELPQHRALYEAIKAAQRPVFPVTHEGFDQALSWEVRKAGDTIVDKYGGLNNASAYLGILPEC